MSEKQASSEIAQSRERNMKAVEQSEKMWEKHFSHAETELSKKGMFCYGYEFGYADGERAIAESRGQPESGCADNDPERDCKCGGERGKPSCAFPADRPTPTCQNCGWYLFSDTCDRCGASRPEIPCICREGLNNQLCQRHGAIAESQAPQPEK